MNIIQLIIGAIGALGILIFLWGVGENFLAAHHVEFEAKARKVMIRGALVFLIGLILHFLVGFFV